MGNPPAAGPPGNPAENYERYMVPAMFLPWAEDLLRRTAPGRGDRVLDVACGTGAVARLAARLVRPGGAVTGLDANPAMLTVARTIPDPEDMAIEWVHGDAQRLPFPDSSFDTVLCQQGLQFCPDRLAGVREMRRVLVDGGRVGIGVSASLDRQPVHGALNAAIQERIGLPAMAEPFSLGDPDDLRALLVDAGFRSVTVETITWPIRFPDPERFVQLTLSGASAAVKALASMGDAARTALVADLHEDMADLLAGHMVGDDLVVPLTTNVATAHR